MDFVDILNREIYPEYGHWYGCTKSYLINDPNWQEIGKGYLKKLTTFTAGIIGAYKIRKIEWNKYGDCLDWILNGDNWIRFRLSGTEPKFKIYYNLYASSQALAIKEYNSINETLLKLLGIKEN
jgi:phosphomannomutase